MGLFGNLSTVYLIKNIFESEILNFSAYASWKNIVDCFRNRKILNNYYF